MNSDSLKEVNTYTDLRLTNILQQANFFDAETVAAAEDAARRRGLYTDEQIALFKKYPEIKSLIGKKLAEGLPHSSLAALLKDRYALDEVKAEEMISSAQNQNTKRQAAEKGGMEGIDGKVVAIGVVILFFLIKMLLRSF